MPVLPELKEIKEIRRKLNLNQEKIGIDLCIPQATISRIENSIGNPSYFTVKKIFDYLELEKLNRKKSEKIAEDIMSKKVIFINSKSTIKDAVELMNKYNISQVPIIDGNNNIGSITSKKIRKNIISNPNLINVEVDLIKELPFPEIEQNWDIKNISKLLTNYPAVLVKKNNNYIGIITDADLIKTT